MLVLITYDVNTEDPAGRTPAADRQAVRQLRPAVQNSVFECKLDPAQYKLLQAKLCAIMDPNGTVSAFIPWEIAMSRRSSTLAVSRPTFQTNL